MKLLTSEREEHDSCGVGAIVNINGTRNHQTVSDALHIVENLDHRAGRDADGTTGDGVGILTQIPYAFFQKICPEFHLPQEFAVGMIFFPQDAKLAAKARNLLEVIAAKQGCRILGWRKVKTHPEVLSLKAVSSCPTIMQCFVSKPSSVSMGIEFDRKLYVIRRIFEASNPDTYICSLSSRTIVYKGMFLVGQLRTFYDDLQQADYVSSLALVHSRFSTNTMPSWSRAHPNRYIMHNGEINTIKGNAAKMLSREEVMSSEVFQNLDEIYPVVNASGSDSAMLDNTLEFMMMNGTDLPQAVMELIPEAWQNQPGIDQRKKDFYEYHATMMEPWDGPANIVFSDGDLVGAVLDRNGLRPSRYYVTDDGRVILSSEVGVLDIPAEHVIRKDRLKPGKMLLVDTKAGRIISDEEIKMKYACSHPYGEWLSTNLLQLKNLKIPNERTIEISSEELQKQKKLFDYSYEDLHDYIQPMALDGKEPTVSMGDDIPLAVLSSHYQPLFNFFQQSFAQVTNPPIDSIREECVTSSAVYLGRDGNLLKDDPANCHVLKIENPILSNLDLLKIRNMHAEGFKIGELSMLYYKNTALEKALDHLFNEADKLLASGCNILILSDRGVDENHVAMPSLLAVSGLNQYLVRTKKRMTCALILETAEPREVHHFAVLLGYGASAVNPYLAHDCIRELIDTGRLNKDYYAAVRDYDLGLLKGIIKIASKMGISTIQSYQGSQNFEAVGLSEEVTSKYFNQPMSRIGGWTLKQIEAESDAQHSLVFDPYGRRVSLVENSRGDHRLRSNQETHLFNPNTIHLLQKAVRNNDSNAYQSYAEEMEQQESGMRLRGCLSFQNTKSIPLSEVEPAEEIMKRFRAGAMSYGALSRECHDTIAIAMNRLDAKSDSGEGGEEEQCYQPLANGDTRCSRIKQVASARFGVTLDYLNHAVEIEIKMAQGAKPGEGGQLPGQKVYPWIAKARHATPGVTLISPPPHHDIYSIEDLAQLIYDLKCANDNARITVKLASELGVGTVAAGVAKAGAQVILISGFDGGTGAAPKNAVYHAGLPWELGIAEAEQALVQNGLRNKVILETDGKLLCGRDIAVAALLGAEEFGFGSAVLVSLGCVMMRVCSLDTCPVGVCTQNPELRKKFTGKPEHVMNLMRFLAEDVRRYMAQLGFHTMDEMIGRSDLLQQKADMPAGLNLERLCACVKPEKSIADKQWYDFHLDSRADTALMDESFERVLKNQSHWHRTAEVHNTDRAFGTRLGSRITRMYPKGIKDDTFTIDCHGSGGQSFGAFIPSGFTLNLTGDCNDYLGKGLSGGILSVKSEPDVIYDPGSSILIGNVALYGATSGKVFISGTAGERFAVRNSGALAVCEGCGDHGLEYMTGGTVMILGSTGRNFAAGMSGGTAYVYDPLDTLYASLNTALVKMDAVSEKHDMEVIHSLLNEHVQRTDSVLAKRLLDRFEEEIVHFKRIVPTEYQKMMKLIHAYEEKGLPADEAELEAFNAAKGGH